MTKGEGPQSAYASTNGTDGTHRVKEGGGDDDVGGGDIFCCCSMLLMDDIARVSAVDCDLRQIGAQRYAFRGQFGDFLIGRANIPCVHFCNYMDFWHLMHCVKRWHVSAYYFPHVASSVAVDDNKLRTMIIGAICQFSQYMLCWAHKEHTRIMCRLFLCCCSSIVVNVVLYILPSPSSFSEDGGGEEVCIELKLEFFKFCSLSAAK